MKSFEHGYLLEQPITQNILRMVHTLGEYRGRQALYQDQSPQLLESLRQAARIESVESSNRIEGIEVPRKQIEEIVLERREPTGRAEEEVAGYRDVLTDIHTIQEWRPINLSSILSMHGKMMARTSEKGGIWKQQDNAIREVRPDGRSVVRFYPVSAVATSQYMASLCSLYEQTLEEGNVVPLLATASFVFDFSCVHPFRDGNGRMGRLLTLLLLYRNGYEVGRYIGLERLVETSKETYYEALLASSEGWHEGRHDLRPWWNYFLGTLIAAYREFESRVGSLQSVRGAKSEMVREVIIRLPARFSMNQLKRACLGVSQETIRQVLRRMRDAGELSTTGYGPAAVWEKMGPSSAPRNSGGTTTE